jgi:hypothetical protein
MVFFLYSSHNGNLFLNQEYLDWEIRPDDWINRIELIPFSYPVDPVILSLLLLGYFFPVSAIQSRPNRAKVMRS